MRCRWLRQHRRYTGWLSWTLLCSSAFWGQLCFDCASSLVAKSTFAPAVSRPILSFCLMERALAWQTLNQLKPLPGISGVPYLRDWNSVVDFTRPVSPQSRAPNRHQSIEASAGCLTLGAQCYCTDYFLSWWRIERENILPEPSSGLCLNPCICVRTYCTSQLFFWVVGVFSVTGTMVRAYIFHSE